MKINNLLIVNLENDNYVGRMYWNRYHYFKSRQGAEPVFGIVRRLRNVFPVQMIVLSVVVCPGYLTTRELTLNRCL